ncbi:NAD(P)/FAD-dependent oxidoreductase [Pseudoalteromonas sp. S16_S37]|uniref:NAD(P)/FAD-dependent oxidoreductase n=1 Tax=Pseudoalteromonas sp. S16_S37 TaxID=2720228 RepID=UPI0016809A1D|nr:FAD-dependent oxidoreductase [Pseudoalteromonas sp. S16_S37]MBD1582746.1 FAD-binding oxidoreductase [Pseudoalteromonas sp. S16_S37]
MTKKEQKIAVIGAGIIGLCVAKQLRDKGYRVSLFDSEGIAQRCSKGNAGHFATEQVFPLANKKLLPKLPSMIFNPRGALSIKASYALKMLPWFCRFLLNMREKPFKAHTQALKALNEHALPAYDELLADSNYQELLTKNGSLLTFEKTSHKDIEKMYRDFKAQDVSVVWLDKKALHELEPNISEQVTDALFFPDVGHSVDPHQLCMHIFNLYNELGGEYIQQKVTNIVAQSAQSTITTSANNTYHFDKIVVCTGAWSKPLAKQLGFKVPLDTERGYHAMVEKHGILSRPVASAERQFIITPMQQGLRLAGTVEFAGLDAPERTHRATMLLGHAQNILTDIEHCQITQTWMGCRPSLPDSLPVISSAPDNENILFAFGHQHLGLTQAAITAKLIAQLCHGEQPSLDLTPYRINRF